MPLVSWDDSLVLGISQFDEHHRHLVSLLNGTYDLFIAEKKDKEMQQVIDDLIDYATYHFAAEEAWMDRLEYPGHKEHKRQHDEFSLRAVEFQRKLAADQTPVTLEVLSFLQRWLVQHIKSCDAEYAAYIKNGPM